MLRVRIRVLRMGGRKGERGGWEGVDVDGVVENVDEEEEDECVDGGDHLDSRDDIEVVSVSDDETGS